jgi:hypothetical protein
MSSSHPDPKQTSAQLKLVAPEHVADAKTLADGEKFAEDLLRQISQAVADSVDFESADAIAKTAAD